MNLYTEKSIKSSYDILSQLLAKHISIPNQVAQSYKWGVVYCLWNKWASNFKCTNGLLIETRIAISDMRFYLALIQAFTSYLDNSLNRRVLLLTFLIIFCLL